MALIDCPECQNKISDSASTCPHCGYPFACPECGGKLLDQPETCPFCGYPFVLAKDERLDADPDHFSRDSPPSNTASVANESSLHSAVAGPEKDGDTTRSEEKGLLKALKEQKRKEHYQLRRNAARERKRRREFLAKCRTFQRDHPIAIMVLILLGLVTLGFLLDMILNQKFYFG